MRPDQRRILQMSTVLRLRAMQSDKASQLYARMTSAFTRAQATLDESQALYADTARRFLQQRDLGVSLDPALYEMQLQGLLSMRNVLSENEAHVRLARADLLNAKTGLNEARVNKHIADKALAGLESDLERYRGAQESVDAADAQLAKEGRNGV